MTSSLVDRVRTRLAAEAAPLGPVQVNAAARRETELIVDSETLAEMTDGLTADLTGAGALEPLLALPGVTDVLVNSADEVWIDRGAGLERSTVRFDSDAAVRRLACRLAAQAGRRLDDAAPFVDASLPDGSRLHAILPPLVQHPCICLRVLTRRRLSLTDLVLARALDADLADVLRAVITARLTLLISGGTGTGKTTLLAGLLAEVSVAERIITIEDAAELALNHPHAVSLVARQANIEGTGSVAMAELVRQALRMRADRLIVGEFRGAEITDLLSALNTGHSGGAATVHANSVNDVRARLIALAALGGMSADVLLAQATSAFDVLVHVRRNRAGHRYLDQVALWPREQQDPVLVWSSAAGLGPGAPVLRARLLDYGLDPPPMLARC